MCDSSCNAESIALSLVAVAELLIKECKIEFIVVCQIIERKCSPFEEYNERVALINFLVKDSLRSNPRAKFWTQQGLNDPAADIYLEDGVHLKDVGNKALYKGYRGPILCPVKAVIFRIFESFNLHVYNYSYKRPFLYSSFMA